MVCNTVLPFFDIETETPPEGEFPIKMKDSNVPMAYKDNITLLSIYIIICLISKNKLITLFL